MKLGDRGNLSPRGWATPMRRREEGRNDWIRRDESALCNVIDLLWISGRYDIDTLQSRTATMFAKWSQDGAYTKDLLESLRSSLPFISFSRNWTNKQFPSRWIKLNGYFAPLASCECVLMWRCKKIAESLSSTCWFNYSQFQLWFIGRLFDCVSKGSSWKFH